MLMKSFMATIAGMAMAASLIASDTQHTTTPSALQGTWRLTSLNGRSIPDQGPQITLSIVGEKYQQAVDGKVTERGTLTLDASKQPMTIDLAITEGDDSGKAQIGIVEVTDGTCGCVSTLLGRVSVPPSSASRTASSCSRPARMSRDTQVASRPSPGSCGKDPLQSEPPRLARHSAHPFSIVAAFHAPETSSIS